jgi:hypothetical protein
MQGGGGGGSTPEREREFAGRGNGRDSVNVTKNSTEDMLTQRPKALGWERDIFCTFSVLFPGASFFEGHAALLDAAAAFHHHGFFPGIRIFIGMSHRLCNMRFISSFSMILPLLAIFFLIICPSITAAAPSSLKVLASCDGSIVLTLNGALWLQVSPLPPSSLRWH